MKNCCGRLRISCPSVGIVHRWLVILVVGGALLSGCARQPLEPQLRPQVQPQPSQAQHSAEQRRLDLEWRIMELLRDAERALQRDRLMLPERDNAYDRFNAVLKLQPDNQQARQGLQAIVVRYVQLGRDALAASRLSSARHYAARAALVDADNPLLQEFDRSLQVAAERQTRSSTIAPLDSDEGDTVAGVEYPLDPTALTKKADAILQLLADIAQRVTVSDETVLLVARNDAEGRWLYQQMKKAAAGYRIRGDIQIGPIPKVVLYPPIQ